MADMPRNTLLCGGWHSCLYPGVALLAGHDDHAGRTEEKPRTESERRRKPEPCGGETLLVLNFGRNL